MNTVLVIGSGGREHALAWKLAQSNRVTKVYIAPGNAGTALVGENVAIERTNTKELVQFAKSKKITLTVVGQDDSLAVGVVDGFLRAGLSVFGPTKHAALIESSKVFSKNLMQKLGIPTAEYAVFANKLEAEKYLKMCQLPVVIKADGLALGKGVYICKTVTEAKSALKDCFVAKLFGSAGTTVVIEEFLEGPEITLHAISDGKTTRVFPVAQDHKPIGEGNTGPNTGGMGSIAPVPGISPAEIEQLSAQVIEPVIAEFARTGQPFVGCLYPGLMLTPKGVRVLEYNARFGDPECQIYLRLLQNDLFELLLACTKGELDRHNLVWSNHSAVCICLASAGYPNEYKKGIPITGIEKAEADPSVVVFQAGTKRVGKNLQTNGGRVLNVTAVGSSIDAALKLAYQAVDTIHFRGMQYRTDIGKFVPKKN